MSEMVIVRKAGLYCVPGGFYVDPWRPVERAIITHAHADHARVGHGHYLTAAPGAGILRARLGEINIQGLEYGTQVVHNGVHISLHPAGHVLGSAQVRLESELRRAMVIAPPSAGGSPWIKRFGDFSAAFASGWMLLRGARRRRGVDRGFVRSDHADWPGLMAAIKATGAGRVIVTHGSIPVMVRWLCQNGFDASGFDTEYGDDEAEDAAAAGSVETVPQEARHA